MCINHIYISADGFLSFQKATEKECYKKNIGLLQIGTLLLHSVTTWHFDPLELSRAGVQALCSSSKKNLDTILANTAAVHPQLLVWHNGARSHNMQSGCCVVSHVLSPVATR